MADHLEETNSNGNRPGNYKYKLQEEMKTKLEEEFPEVLEFIYVLQKYIKRQQKKIKRLKHNQKKKTVTADIALQTGEEKPPTETKSLTEDIKEAAELATQNTGFVYEETSGMYYDYSSGYYYNAELGLYYNGNTGTYMTYDSENGTYSFHSRVEVVPNPSSEIHKSKCKIKRKVKTADKSKVKQVITSDMAKLTFISGCKRERSEEVSLADLEEGECSDSSQNSGENEDSDNSHNSDNETGKVWPPCMRIIIKNTLIPKIKEGTLHIITIEGGSLGREGDHSIILPDINISKQHLKFEFDKETNRYLLIDLGSRNGTILNGKRMSAPTEESIPMEVPHGSQIQIGSTTLLCHIHKGNETCGHCEPGLIQQTEIDNKEPILTKQELHKKELKNLKKKFGIESYVQPKVDLADGYTDRAHVRRKTVGSLNENEKTEVASVNQSISSENKGFKLLSKMGWSEGQSLGKDGTGVINPVELDSTIGNAGLGYKGVPMQVNGANAMKKDIIWKQVQMRYESLPQTKVFSDSE